MSARTVQRLLHLIAAAILCALPCGVPLRAQARQRHARDAAERATLRQSTAARSTPARTSSAPPPVTRKAQQTGVPTQTGAPSSAGAGEATAAQTPRVPEGDADLAIIANVQAKELKFETVPNPAVEFPGRPARTTEWSAERTNLPPQVEPGVTYRDIGIRLKIVSRFADIDRIVAEALGETPPPDDSSPPAATEPPSAQPLAAQPSAPQASATQHARRATRTDVAAQRRATARAARRSR